MAQKPIPEWKRIQVVGLLKHTNLPIIQIANRVKCSQTAYRPSLR